MQIFALAERQMFSNPESIESSIFIHIYFSSLVRPDRRYRNKMIDLSRTCRPEVADTYIIGLMTINEAISCLLCDIGKQDTYIPNMCTTPNLSRTRPKHAYRGMVYGHFSALYISRHWRLSASRFIDPWHLLANI